VRPRTSVTQSAVALGPVSLLSDERAGIRGFATRCDDRRWRRGQFNSKLDVNEKSVGDSSTASGELNEHGSIVGWMEPSRHQAPFLASGHDERDAARNDQDVAVEFGDGEFFRREACESSEYAKIRPRYPEAIEDRAVAALHEIADGQKSGGVHFVLMIQVGTDGLEALHIPSH
jgi:hypothetical protein